MSFRRWLAAFLGVPFFALFLLVAYGWFEARRDPVVGPYTVALADWPAGTPPLRIVQLSDIHFGWPDMPEARIHRIVVQVNALNPDLIVLSGDYQGGKLWDADIGTMDVAVRPLRGLRARLGVIAVRGNHDGPYWTQKVFAKTPILLLQNRWIDLGPVVVAGLDDITGQPDPKHAAASTIQGAPAGKPLILLAHEPNFFQWLPKRVDLMLAGHTHGGQIRLPLVGGRSTGSPYLDKHLRGRFDEHGQTMIVSSGLGTSIVPLRIGVPPEIALISLGGYSVGRKSGTDR